MLLTNLLLSIAFVTSAHAQDDQALKALEAGRTQRLSEEKVLELFRKDSVGTKRERAQAALTQLDSSLTRETYQARAYSTVNVKRSQEQAQNLYQPVLSPYEDWNVGVEKKLPLGAKLGLEAFGSKYSFAGGTVQDATLVGGRVKGEVDLWKNIFGTLDRAQLQSADARRRRAEVEEKVNLKKLELELRKAFWSFVALNRSIELSEELVKSAERQMQDARSRAREGAADRGEVARYQSQVESRNTTKLLFMYQQEVALQTFERQFTGFRSSEWSLDNASLANKTNDVDQCMSMLRETTPPNLDHTNYDELIELLKAETESEMRAAKRYANMDIKLLGEYQTTGVDTTYERAREETFADRRGGYHVGLQVSVPIGGTKNESEKHLLRAKKDSLEAQSEGLANDLRSQHDTMIKAMLFLRMGLKNQIENSKNLNINYTTMLNKYRQGRIPVSTLILEQDSLFQSKLTEIDLRKQIVHVLLDYFSIFNQFPCRWNQI